MSTNLEQLLSQIKALEVENKELRQKFKELEEHFKTELDDLRREIAKPVNDDKIDYLVRRLEELSRDFVYHRHQSVFGMYTGKPE
ncbi:MAG: hypothetical protein H0Z35_09110 [Thermoanaerobacteraceae bacterium]|nr:hypothetical protein [Thermoanaerobacteraceae bacterium]